MLLTTEVRKDLSFITSSLSTIASLTPAIDAITNLCLKIIDDVEEIRRRGTQLSEMERESSAAMKRIENNAIGLDVRK